MKRCSCAFRLRVREEGAKSMGGVGRLGVSSYASTRCRRTAVQAAVAVYFTGVAALPALSI